MLTDIAALVIALLTLWIAQRPATHGKTYGYLRAEILGALINGLILWMLVAFIWIEALKRLRTPESVSGLPVMVVAAVGVAVNTLLAWLTAGKASGLAMRAIFLHVCSDLLGSVGGIIAGALVYFTGWERADSAVSIFIGALVLWSSWGLVRDGVDILMESVPRSIDVTELRNELLMIKGTEEIHDLHVWCLGSRQFAMSAHAVIAPDSDYDKILSDIASMLGDKFDIHHITVQLERDSRRLHEPSHF
jgi:cobalt-zinc-cadmium efflux system protein